MKLVDTHCHVHFNAFKGDMDETVRAALASGVGIIAVGTQKDTSLNGIKLAERHDNVWASVGLHPSHLFEGYVDEQEVQFKSRNETFDVEFYRSLLKHPKVVAVGEMGLDYFHTYETISLEDQKKREAEAFEAGARLAIEEDVPVIIHCRDGSTPLTTGAHEDQIALIEKIWGPGPDPVRGQAPVAPRGVIHCFTGTKHDAERYFALGFYVSFTGVITFPPKKADIAAGKELLTDVVKWAPLDKIMVETDAPYLTPMPFRGKRNLPEYVKHVASKIAELKGLSFDEVAEATTANAKRLFRKMVV
jgi:TatD DNase family protein